MRRTQASRIAAGLVLAAWFFTACSQGSPSVLDGQGESARRVSGLWWLMLWISAAVFAVVGALLVVAIARRRRFPADAPDVEPGWGEPFIVIAGVLVPALILAAVFVISVRDLNAITRSGDDARLTVHVIGHVWWWEARYPNGAVTANEIHIPVGEPVRLQLTTVDVIHSFWVPQLAPKMDMIPGRTNTLVLNADRPGRYRGQCAEYCGLQHANMALFVVAQPSADFDAWLADQATSAAAPASDQASRGLDVFLSAGCAGCHTIRGTPADGELGPDLTHLASRETIAAGTLTNAPESLASWIGDAQAIKPGAVMPPFDLSPADLQALIDYLEGLR